MLELPWALLSLAEEAPLPCLTELTVTIDSAWSSFIRGVTRAFKAGRLPYLTKLQLGAKRDSNVPRTGATNLFDSWTDLGIDKIKLKRLNLKVRMTAALKARLLELLVDPSFCPRLRIFQSTMKKEDIQTAFAVRWDRIEAAEAMGGQ